MKKFIDIQKIKYNTALKEIQQGKKTTHWIWYIFPQISGLGNSEKTRYYEIKSLEEARDYLYDYYLRNNLIKILRALLEHYGKKNIVDILGSLDATKLLSSMTLFKEAGGDNICGGIFTDIINKFYQGKLDDNTLYLLYKQKKNYQNYDYYSYNSQKNYKNNSPIKIGQDISNRNIQDISSFQYQKEIEQSNNAGKNNNFGGRIIKSWENNYYNDNFNEIFSQIEDKYDNYNNAHYMNFENINISHKNNNNYQQFDKGKINDKSNIITHNYNQYKYLNRNNISQSYVNSNLNKPKIKRESKTLDKNRKFSHLNYPYF